MTLEFWGGISEMGARSRTKLRSVFVFKAMNVDVRVPTGYDICFNVLHITIHDIFLIVLATL